MYVRQTNDTSLVFEPPMKDKKFPTTFEVIQICNCAVKDGMKQSGERERSVRERERERTDILHLIALRIVIQFQLKLQRKTDY